MGNNTDMLPVPFIEDITFLYIYPSWCLHKLIGIDMGGLNTRRY